MTAFEPNYEDMDTTLPTLPATEELDDPYDYSPTSKVKRLEEQLATLKEVVTDANQKSIEYHSRWMKLSEQSGGKNDEILRLNAALGSVRDHVKILEDRNATLVTENQKAQVFKSENEVLKRHFKVEPKFHAFMKAVTKGSVEDLSPDMKDIIDLCMPINDSKSLIVLRYLSMKLSTKARAQFFSYVLDIDTHPDEFPTLFRVIKGKAQKLYITDKGKTGL